MNKKRYIKRECNYMGSLWFILDTQIACDPSNLINSMDGFRIVCSVSDLNLIDEILLNLNGGVTQEQFSSAETYPDGTLIN